MMFQRLRAFGTLTLAIATLTACQAPAAPVVAPDGSQMVPVAAASAAPAAPAATPGASAPAPAVVRQVTVVPDPKGDTRQLVTTYWSYGKDAPYQIDGYEARPAGVNEKTGHTQVAFEADIRLPEVGPRQRRVLEAAAIGTVCVAPSLDPMSDTNAPTASDAGATALDEVQRQQEALLPTVAEAVKALTQPHHVTAVADNESYMANAVDHYTVTDDFTGESVLITYDQFWTRFAFTSGGRTVALEFSPDGTYLVDGHAAATVRDAVTMLEASSVVAQASPYSLAMIAARIGRLAPAGSRGAPTCNPPSGLQGEDAKPRVSYRTLSADSPDPQARAFVLANAVLKNLLVGEAAAKP